MGKYITALVVVVGVVLVNGDKYTEKFDHINVDDILKSERLVNNYAKCMLNKGPCTADAQEMKKNLPDALQNECSKCTETQKVAGRKVLHYLLNKRPKLFAELELLYDPTGVFRTKYQDRVKALEASWEETPAA